MHVVIWVFTVRPEQEAAFEAAYGPSGPPRTTRRWTPAAGPSPPPSAKSAPSTPSMDLDKFALCSYISISIFDIVDSQQQTVVAPRGGENLVVPKIAVREVADGDHPAAVSAGLGVHRSFSEA